MSDKSNNSSGGGLIKLSGLWAAKTKDGATYLSGTMTPTARLIIFKNAHKKNGSKEPDYIAYVAQNQPKEKAARDPEPEDL